MELGRCGRWKLIAGRKPTTSGQAIGFEAPSQRSLGNCPELGRRPGTGLTGSVFAAGHHFAHLGHDVGEADSATLFLGDPRPHCQPQGHYECEEARVTGREQSVRQIRDASKRISWSARQIRDASKRILFHERRRRRWGVASSAGIPSRSRRIGRAGWWSPPAQKYYLRLTVYGRISERKLVAA